MAWKPMVQFNFRCPPEQATAAQQAAQVQGISVSAWMLAAVREKLERECSAD